MTKIEYSTASKLPLVIGVSTRALFSLEEEHNVFDQQGGEAYAALQLERERVLLQPGAAFEVIKRLLSLNPEKGDGLVEVIFLSKNSPDLSLRAFYSSEQHGLKRSYQRGWSYVAGYATTKYGGLPIEHAWAIDPDGFVVDLTWAGRVHHVLGKVDYEKEVDRLYFGIVLQVKEVEICLLNEEVMSPLYSHSFGEVY